MHTVSTYPMKDEDANLNVINTLKEKFNCNVGYSGHENWISNIMRGCIIRYKFFRKAYNFRQSVWI